MNTRDVTSGALFLGLSVIFYTQTLTSPEESIYISEVDPMLYPRALVLLMGAMGAWLGIRGLLAKPVDGDFPVFTKRTVGIAIILLLYAALFNTLGFFITSVLACYGIACVMGYRKFLFLGFFCVLAVVLVWFMYIYILRIPLPVGTLF